MLISLHLVTVFINCMHFSKFHFSQICNLRHGRRYLDLLLLQSLLKFPSPSDQLSLVMNYFLTEDCLFEIHHLIVPCLEFRSPPWWSLIPSSSVFADVSMLWKYFLLEDYFLKDSMPDFVAVANSFATSEWIFNIVIFRSSLMCQCCFKALLNLVFVLLQRYSV